MDFDNPLGLRSTPPFVAHRHPLTDDPNGSREPVPDWMPSGWESWSYPRIGDVQAIREWLEYQIRNNEQLAEVHGLLLSGHDIPEVRDAYGLAKHLQKQKGWDGIPGEPHRKFISSNELGDVYRDVAHELRKVLDWINGQLTAVQAKKNEVVARKEPQLLDSPVQVVERWEDLGIGIDEDGSYLAVSPAPEYGKVFPKEKAKKLDLPGKQWGELLHLLAESKYGNTAAKNDVILAFKYARPGEISEKDLEELQEGSAERHIAMDAIKKLTPAISNLGRNLREQVHCRKQSTVLSVKESGVVRSLFVVRYLKRGRDGKLHFGMANEVT